MLPSAVDYGDEFDYAVWTAGTTVRLCNVRWNSDYRDIVKWRDRGARDVYFANLASRSITVNNVQQARFGYPIQLDIPFNQASRYNYIVVTNPTQPIAQDFQKTFYYFISSVEYVAPNTTRIMVQLDVWQTFGDTVQFGNAYVERGHIGIAASKDADTSQETIVINQPEGLDIGGEYVIEKIWSRDIGTARSDADFQVLVMSSVALDVPAKINGVPNLQSADGSTFENLPNGCVYYLFQNPEKFREFMTAYKEFPWLTQGIMSIQAVPKSYVIATESTGSHNGVVLLKVNAGSIPNTETKLAPNWRAGVTLGPANRYRNLKKFLTFPYCALELTTYTGTPIIIKPEAWNNDDAEIVEMAHFASSGARIMFYPMRYNAGQGSPRVNKDINIGVNGGVVNAIDILHDGGEFLDMATGILNLPTFSLVNDGYASYMASNFNGINYQNSSADWSQQRALTGNQLSFDQASAGISTSQQINKMGITAANQQLNQTNETTVLSGIQGGVNGAIGGLRGGGPVGAAMGIANAAAEAAISINQATGSTAISNNLSASTNRAQTGLQGYMRDSNKDYADYATTGDYQNTIAGINAKVQDARLTQPTTSGQVGGDAFNLAKYKWGYDLKLKMLQPSAMRSIGEYWLRYGYQVNQFIRTLPASLMTMEKFTYWKLRETYVVSSECPETYKQAIRGIFEKGVTVWREPNDIGTVDIADNTPLNGITL